MATTTTTTGDRLLNLVEVRALARSGRAREIRLRAGLSLADLGGAIGVAAGTVQRWEHGLRKPYGDAALRYGALLKALATVEPQFDHFNESSPPAATAGSTKTTDAGGRRVPV